MPGHPIESLRSPTGHHLRRILVTETGGLAEVKSASCPSSGNCVAVGHFMARDTATSFSERPFADSQRDGRWAQVIKIRGLPGSVASGEV